MTITYLLNNNIRADTYPKTGNGHLTSNNEHSEIRREIVFSVCPERSAGAHSGQTRSGTNTGANTISRRIPECSLMPVFG